MSLLKRIGGTPPGGGGGGSTSGDDGTTGALRPPPTQPGEASKTSVKSSSSASLERLADLRMRVQMKLADELDITRADTKNNARIRQQIEEVLNSLLASEGAVIGRSERHALLESIISDITGLGPLEPLLGDESISEVMVNGPNHVFVERSGKVALSGVTFTDEEHLMRILQRIVAPLGRRVDESSPMVDARLKDGSRVNAVIRPISLIGPVISIRKFGKNALTAQDLVRFGSISQEMLEFLSACVRARLNIVVSGGTGSGKTTLLNMLSSFIPNDERVITIENAAELQLQIEHWIPLETRPPNIEGQGEVSANDLVINALRMRPERIIVGECRGGEALAMLQAMNTGHDGSMTTGHANSPRDVLSRLETMCLMAGIDLPVRAIREQIASAIHIIVQQSRLNDGSRKVVNVTEVAGIEADMIVLNDIFVFEQTGIDQGGKIVGQLRPTGVRPRFIDKFETMGIYLPPNVFGNTGDRMF